MKISMCTLFDSNYLDKGIVLYNSLIECCDTFRLYILPMDEKCKEVLEDLNLKHVRIVDYNDFEDDDLRKVKKERGRAEFCWTCTAKLIKYVLEKYDEELCTYIDADLYFYQDPTILIQEMIDEKASVQIVEHNFRKYERRESEKKAGRFCVEFNTFLNNKEGKKVLDSWEADCVNDCSYGKNEGVMGDQKYLHEWPQRYTCVNICKNQGGGVAPWNVNKFKYNKDNENRMIITDTESNKKYPLVFYHFQNIVYIEDNTISCCDVDKRIRTEVGEIYNDYLVKIADVKKMLLEKYGISVLIKKHPAEEANKCKKRKTPKDFFLFLKKGPMHIFKSIMVILNAKVNQIKYERYYEPLIIKLEK